VPDWNDLHFLFHLETDVLHKCLPVGNSPNFNGERQRILKISAQLHWSLFILTQGSCISLAQDFSGHRVNLYVDLQDPFCFSSVAPGQPQIAICTGTSL
jgi:hypothetical protein